MSTITGSNITNATGFTRSEPGRRMFLDSSGATDFDATGTADANGRNTFLADKGFSLAVNYLNLTNSNQAWTFRNGNITYVAGPAAITSSGLNTVASGVTNSLLTIEDCNITATNGAQNGFGQAGSGAVADLIIRNNIYDIAGTTSPDGTTWFINGENYSANTIFANNLLLGSVFNTPVLGNLLFGITFDGTTRQQGGFATAYTTRINGFERQTTRNNSGAMQCVYPGTYTGVNVHFQYSTGFQTDNPIYYLYNNRYENGSIRVVIDNGGAPNRDDFRCGFVEGYVWRPVFTDVVSGADITDVRIVGIPANTRILPATFSPTTALTPAADGAVNSTGYYFQTDSIADTVIANNATISELNNKALDFTTGAVRTSNVHNVRFKSYTHLASTADTQVSLVDFDGTNYTFTDENSHSLQYSADPNLNGRAVDATQTAPAEILRELDDFYPTIKRAWAADNSLNTEFPFTVSGSSLISTLPLDVVSAMGSRNSITSSLVTIYDDRNNATTPGTIQRIQVPSTGTRSEWRNGFLPDPAILAGQWDITGSLGTTITFDGNFTGVPHTNNSFSSVTVEGGSVLDLLPTSSDITIRLSNSWRDVTFNGTGSTIQSAGPGTITLESDEALAAVTAGNLTAGSNVNIVAVPAPAEQPNFARVDLAGVATADQSALVEITSANRVTTYWRGRVFDQDAIVFADRQPTTSGLGPTIDVIIPNLGESGGPDQLNVYVSGRVIGTAAEAYTVTENTASENDTTVVQNFNFTNIDRQAGLIDTSVDLGTPPKRFLARVTDVTTADTLADGVGRSSQTVIGVDNSGDLSPMRLPQFILASANCRIGEGAAQGSAASRGANPTTNDDARFYYLQSMLRKMGDLTVGTPANRDVMEFQGTTGVAWDAITEVAYYSLDADDTQLVYGLNATVVSGGVRFTRIDDDDTRARIATFNDSNGKRQVLAADPQVIIDQGGGAADLTGIARTTDVTAAQANIETAITNAHNTTDGVIATRSNAIISNTNDAANELSVRIQQVGENAVPNRFNRPT